MTRQIEVGRIEMIDDTVAEMLRNKTMAERVEMISAANRTMRLLIEGGLRTQNPSWSDDQIKHEVLRRMSRGTS